MKPSRPFMSLWGMPIALGVLSASGLATALVSETWGDWWAWVALGAPVVVMAWYAWPRSARATLPVDLPTPLGTPSHDTPPPS